MKRKWVGTLEQRNKPYAKEIRARIQKDLKVSDASITATDLRAALDEGKVVRMNATHYASCPDEL